MYQILIPKFGIRRVEEFVEKFKIEYANIVYVSNFFEIFEKSCYENFNMILISDYRGEENSLMYTKFYRRHFKNAKIILLANENIGEEKRVFYIQKGAYNYLKYDQIESIIESIDQDYYKNIKKLKYNRKIINILSALYKNYNKRINKMEEISEKSGYSIPHIYRVLKKELGKSPGEILNKLRIKESIRLLKNTDYPIKYISTQVGYKSQQGYIKAFKQIMNKTPTEFRNEK